MNLTKGPSSGIFNNTDPKALSHDCQAKRLGIFFHQKLKKLRKFGIWTFAQKIWLDFSATVC